MERNLIISQLQKQDQSVINCGVKPTRLRVG